MVGRSAANVHQSLQAAVQSPNYSGLMSPGQSSLNHLNQMSNLNMTSNNANQSFVGAPIQQTVSTPDNGNYAAVQFSAKHDGLYIYVGRIVRPIWQMKCVTKSIAENKDFVSIFQIYSNYLNY